MDIDLKPIAFLQCITSIFCNNDAQIGMEEVDFVRRKGVQEKELTLLEEGRRCIGYTVRGCEGKDVTPLEVGGGVLSTQ